MNFTGKTFVSCLESSGVDRFLDFSTEKSISLSDCYFSLPKNLKAIDSKEVYFNPLSGLIGFKSVVSKLPLLPVVFKSILKIINQNSIQRIVLVDSPDFHIPLLRFLRFKGYKGRAEMLVPPQAWAWRPSRAAQVASLFDKVYSFFPFEVEFYKKSGSEVELIKSSYFKSLIKRGDQPISKRKGLVICPGSRSEEVKKIIPHLKSLSLLFKKHFPGEEIFISLPNGGIKDIPESIKVISDKKRLIDKMSEARLGLLCSGTITLEAAMLGLNSLVYYQVGKFNARIFRVLTGKKSLPYIALPSWIIGEKFFTEYISEAGLDTEELFNKLSQLSQIPEAELLDRRQRLRDQLS